MNGKILIAATYPEMRQMAEDLSPTWDCPLVPISASLEEMASALEKIDLNEISAIVGEGLAAEFLKSIVPEVPVIKTRLTPEDISRALVLFPPEEEVLVIAGPEGGWAWERPSPSWRPGVHLSKVGGNTREEVMANTEVRLREFYSAGLRNMVGETFAVRIGQRLGMKTVLVQCSPESLAEAVRIAQAASVYSEKNREKEEWFKTILDYAHEGIMMVDENGIIIVFNAAAERITGIRSRDAIGNPVHQVFAAGRTLRVLKEDKDEINVVENLGGERIITNRVMIRSRGRMVGVLCTFQDILYVRKAEAQIRRDSDLRGHVARFTFNDIIGSSRGIRETINMAKRFSQVDATVLIHGESGTGKEILAQGIHNDSSRRSKPFVAINCAALPENLLESELFGYVKGAFTGAAREGKPGLFELAHQGTIFLDEISEMAPVLQARMLRVLQQKEVMRLGHDRVIPIDVRIIAATNADLGSLVQQNRFRKDLYFRLNILRLSLPPLRERKEDIPLLLHYFFSQFAREAHDPVRWTLSDAALRPLLKYDWPGNIRELENVARRLFLLSADFQNLTEGEVESFVREVMAEDRRPPDRESDPLLQVLSQAGNNMTRAARLLGVSRTTLWRRLRPYRRSGWRQDPKPEPTGEI